jgi:Arabinose efflux permease
VLNSFLAYARLVRDPIVWGYALCGGMGFAAMFAYICATPFVYISHFHVSPQTYGLFFGLNVIGVIIGNFINARFVRREGSLRMISAAALVSCVSSVYVAAVCLMGWGGLWAIVVGLFFVVGVIGMLAANCMADMMYRYPRNAGAAAALFGAAQLGFGALATLMVGLWHGTSPVGMGWTIGVSGVLCYVGRMTIVRWHGRPTTEHQVATM